MLRMIFFIGRSFGVCANLGILCRRRGLSSLPDGKGDNKNKLETDDSPERWLDSVGSLRDPATSDSTEQSQDKSNGTAVALIVAVGVEELGVGHEIANHGGNDNGGNLADAESTTADNLAGSLETEKGDGNKFLEFDFEGVVGIGLGGVRAVEDVALDNAGSNGDEKALEEEGEHQGAAALRTKELVEAGERKRANGEATDGKERSSPTEGLVVEA